ncbi:hypothetical protein AGLY_003946 [Aphis glycines]|uniref:Uncharacterized protein n=1 Tax=Aphis glycines TaxID=307491 RepID=A0A6G0TXK3_APHGL|nr:hypothetical protein AGLY_003946 [Aphis glycines]
MAYVRNKGRLGDGCPISIGRVFGTESDNDDDNDNDERERERESERARENVRERYTSVLFYVYTGILKLEDIESETSAFMALHQRLEEELRAAKRAQLSCGEVLLPPDLLHRIAHDVLKMAESEPCGLRGCTLYLNFEGEQECRKIGTIKCDTNTVSTFELFLTLKQNPRNAWSLIPLFIR